MKIFGEDIKLYMSFFPCHWPFSFSPICGALSDIKVWADVWQLGLSIEKCIALYLSMCHKNPELPCKIENSVLKSDAVLRDLGIHMSENLKFSAHVALIVKKAYSRARLIFRCFSIRDVDVLIRAYKVYVRPLLESNSPVWNPNLQTDIDDVEKVQRFFTRRASALCGKPETGYDERLLQLKLDRLQYRRKINDLCICYQIVHNLIDLSFDDFFEYCPERTRWLRSHSKKLFPRHARIDALKLSFSHRSVKLWNLLPESVVSRSNLTSFRCALLHHSESNSL